MEENIDDLRIKINEIETKVYNTYKAQQKYTFNEYLNVKMELKEEISKIKKIINKNLFNNLLISLILTGIIIIFKKDYLLL